MNSKSLTASVIIPVYNDADSIVKVLRALEKIEYTIPCEIIVVDNGSEDNTMQNVKDFPGVKLLTEHHYKNSPYSARNRGIEQSNADIIILLDSTCTPVKDWFIQGVNCLIQNNADIVGGDVQFDFEGRMTAGKIYDSLTNIKMQLSIENKKVAKTANLFIRREVFEKVGFFPEGIRSGADIIWTGKVTALNHKLIFCKNATVFKKARPFLELVKKQWRVGLHQPLIWKEKKMDKTFPEMFLNLLKPIWPQNVWNLIDEKGTAEMKRHFINILLVAQVIKWISNLANIKGSLRLKK